jgi:hypothetical protein
VVLFSLEFAALLELLPPAVLLELPHEAKAMLVAIAAAITAQITFFDLIYYLSFLQLSFVNDIVQPILAVFNAQVNAVSACLLGKLAVIAHHRLVTGQIFAALFGSELLYHLVERLYIGIVYCISLKLS